LARRELFQVLARLEDRQDLGRHAELTSASPPRQAWRRTAGPGGGPQPEVLTGGLTRPESSSAHTACRLIPGPARRPHPERRSAGSEPRREAAAQRNDIEGRWVGKAHSWVFAFGGPATVGIPSVRSVTLRPRLSPGLPFRARGIVAERAVEDNWCAPLSLVPGRAELRRRSLRDPSEGSRISHGGSPGRTLAGPRRRDPRAPTSATHDSTRRFSHQARRLQEAVSIPTACTPRFHTDRTIDSYPCRNSKHERRGRRGNTKEGCTRGGGARPHRLRDGDVRFGAGYRWDDEPECVWDDGVSGPSWNPDARGAWVQNWQCPVHGRRSLHGQVHGRRKRRRRRELQVP